MVGASAAQTIAKTTAVVRQALGSVLYINEAYTLASRGKQDYGREATDTLLKLIEGHPANLIVIAAGAEKLIHPFLQDNPKFQACFPSTLRFEDYGPDDLGAIFARLAREGQYQFSPAAERRVGEMAARMHAERDEDFSNARAIRTRFEQALARQADRLAGRDAPSREELVTLEADDLGAG